MNQEKGITQTASYAGEYLAPSVKVEELRERRVLCASGQLMGSEDDAATFGDD